MKILKNTNIVFGVSIILGFVLPGWADSMKNLLVPTLMMMMTFSLLEFKFSEVELNDIKTVLPLFAMNYLLLTGIHIILAFTFIDNELYRNAILILGLMPPAVGIISMIYILNGDIHIGFMAEITGYAASLLIIPVMSVVFFGESVTMSKIFRIIILVIIVPFILSRILTYLDNKYNFLKKDVSEVVVNLGYAILFYITIGINIDVFLNKLFSLTNIILIVLFLRFGLGAIFYFVFKNKIEKRKHVLYILFGTFKNGSAGLAFTLLLFNDVQAAVPYAILSIISSLYILFLKYTMSEGGKLANKLT